MDSSAPAQLPASRLPLFLYLAGLLLLAAGYAWFLRQHIAPFAGGADSSGYLNSAALLRAGRFSTPVPVLPGHGVDDFGRLAQQPLGFTSRTSPGWMSPSYPLGLPLHLAAFSFLSGLEQAAIPLNICSALAGGGLLYLFARRLGLPHTLALSGLAMLLLCPLFLFSALQPMSDLLALVWTLAALYAAVRAREKPGWAWFCGLAVALAVLVRPTNLLLALPVMLALGSRWRDYLRVAAGGLAGAVLLAWYNREVYGTLFTTGYGDIRSSFGGEFVPHNLAHFARWITTLLTPFIVTGLAVPFLKTARRREFAVLGSWAVVLIGFYAFYYHSGETWWYLRFILPAFPVLILAALSGLHALTADLRQRTIIWGVLLTICLTWETSMLQRLEVLNLKTGEATYAEAGGWVRTHLPPGTAILCMQVSGAFHYYTDSLIFRWDLAEMKPLLQALGEQHRPVYAVLFDFEEQPARQRVGGSWTKLAHIGQATVWQIEPAAP